MLRNRYAPTLSRRLRFGDHGPRRGAVVVLFAAMLPMLCGLVAFGVDVGYMCEVKTKLQATADVTALAAAGSMQQAASFDQIESIACSIAAQNVPSHYGAVMTSGDVTFGVWDDENRRFTATTTNTNAVRVRVARSEANGNKVGLFFAPVIGHNEVEVFAEAIAVGPVPDSSATTSVYVTSSKELSNVVLLFDDGETQKFEDLEEYTSTFQGTGEHEGKEIVSVWIKSGCNDSGEGPGYGERIDHPGDDTTVHGANEHHGCIPHVTVTFDSTGAEFSGSGFVSPVRLVQ